jgi:hypothetical protein
MIKIKRVYKNKSDSELLDEAMKLLTILSHDLHTKLPTHVTDENGIEHKTWSWKLVLKITGFTTHVEMERFLRENK